MPAPHPVVVLPQQEASYQNRLLRRHGRGEGESKAVDQAGHCPASASKEEATGALAGGQALRVCVFLLLLLLFFLIWGCICSLTNALDHDFFWVKYIIFVEWNAMNVGLFPQNKEWGFHYLSRMYIRSFTDVSLSPRN